MFRTPVSVKPVEIPISRQSNLLSWGSCFADFIGEQLKNNKFKIESNPCGIIFHPLAQIELFKLALQQQLPPENSYVRNQGIWYNYLFHSSVSNTSRDKLENNIEQLISRLRTLLFEVDFILMTFGTAIQYKHVETGLLVANCHKIPQREFEKSLTDPESIVLAFKELLTTDGAPAPNIMLSVSPIRHLKEGMEQNSASKSVLRVACEKLRNEHPNTVYFPGFEIMMDDLRDYRFFEKDMIHPNETARDYIWNLFKLNYLDQEAQKFVNQWHKISLNLQHRPFHPKSTAHQEFINKTLSLIQQLPPDIDTTREVDMLKKSLHES